jgi:hypothetical protein
MSLGISNMKDGIFSLPRGTIETYNGNEVLDILGPAKILSVRETITHGQST